MIIQRKYEWLGVLCEKDSKVKKLVDEAFELENVTVEWKKEVLEYNYANIPAFLNIGCGIPGSSYKYIMDGFELLDKEKPYDNGLTFKDINRIEYETSRKGTAIQMRLVNESVDNPYRIVGFIALENKEGKIGLNKGWEMTAPFEIG